MDILMNIYYYLELIKPFPQVTSRRSAVLENKPKSIFFGYRQPHNFYPDEPFYRGNSWYPELYYLLKLWHQTEHPDHKYNVILVNKNTTFIKHRDTKNIKNSRNLIIGLGEYTGGSLITYENNKEIKHDICCNSLFFDPMTPHRVDKFNGTRYTLTYYLIPNNGKNNSPSLLSL